MCNFDKEQLAEKLNQPEEYEKLKNKSHNGINSHCSICNDSESIDPPLIPTSSVTQPRLINALVSN